MADLTNRVRAVIVGAGAIAISIHLPAIAALADRIVVEGISDLDRERAERVAQDWGIPSTFDDLDEMLDEIAPDLVIVCTPPVAHHAAIRSALRGGAWVWCEKPPALSLAEYDEMARLETDGGPYVAYVFQHRFGTAAQRLRELIGSGELGPLRFAACNTLWFRDDVYFEAPWRARWDTEGGGPTMGHGIHQMDLLLYLAGDWQRAQSMMSTVARATETEDVSLAAVRLENGALVSIANSLLSPRESSYLRFDFDDATVEVEHVYGYDNSDWRWTAAPHVTDAARIESWRPSDDLPSSHRAQLESLLDSMSVAERPVASGADGRRVLELITGMYRSAFTGEVVERSEITADDPFYRNLNGGDPENARRVLAPSEVANV